MSKNIDINRPGIDPIKLNEQIAYAGKIGFLRKKYNLGYIENKKRVSTALKQKQLAEAGLNNEVISCRKGCWYCCMYYVEASIQECEAIVYHLYQNKEALSLFLRKYSSWVSAVQNGIRTPLESGSFSREESLTYHKLKIPCPFLYRKACSIYEVRPFSCMGYFVTTSPEECHPDAALGEKRKRFLPAQLASDRSFFIHPLPEPIFVSMPLNIYRILKDGYAYLSKIPGFEDLEETVMNDPEVKNACRRYLKNHPSKGPG
jgi:Fe-S-cluster containining protein